jgi:3-oxoacyl-[acyl-carrier protein] reductase
MKLNIKNKLFVVCGATSGFGNAVAKQLIREKAKIIAIARTEENLKELQDAYSNQVEILAGDITQSKTINALVNLLGDRQLEGILVNAAGPPAITFEESQLEHWDAAYNNLLRWKIELTKALLSKFKIQKYGRFVYIESSAVKQPLENLILSTSFRLSVVGCIKTLSREIPDSGITFNILAPGYHYTPAVERLISKKAKTENISLDKAKSMIENNIPMKITGNVDKFATLAVWLLSPLSEYVNGQVYTVDGGVVQSTL